MGQIELEPFNSSSKFIFLYYLRDAIVFTFIGVILGFLIDYFFPNVKPTDSLWVNIFWFSLQLILDAFILFILFYGYTLIFKIDPDTYLGWTILTVIFFLVQSGLFDRLALIYNEITGKVLK